MPEYETKQVARIRAKREANTELMCSLRNVFRQNSVNADGGKQQSYASKDGHQHSHDVNDRDGILHFSFKRFQFGDGNLRPDLRNGRARGRSVAGWNRSDAQNKPEGASRGLKIRLIDDGKSRRIPPILARITDNSDNGHPGLGRVRRAQLELLPKRIACGPETVRHRAANDGDAPGGSVVGFREESSSNQGDFENGEIVSTDVLQVSSGGLAGLQSRAALNGEQRLFVVHIAGGKVGGQSGAKNSRQGRDPLQSRLEEVVALCAVRIIVQADLKFQNLAGLKPLVGLREPAESLRSQSRANQQDESQRDLRRHKPVAQALPGRAA